MNRTRKINPNLNLLKKSFNFLDVIFVVALIGLLILAIFLIIGTKEEDPEVIHKTGEYYSNESGVSINVTIEADLEVNSSCGGMECFEQKFSECAPATLSSKLTENLIYFYEIIGLKNGLCEVKSKFIANPNPEWVDKEMTCLYDNTLDFETAVQNMENCQGALYILMTEGQI